VLPPPGTASAAADPEVGQAAAPEDVELAVPSVAAQLPAGLPTAAAAACEVLSGGVSSIIADFNTAALAGGSAGGAATGTVATAAAAATAGAAAGSAVGTATASPLHATFAAEASPAGSPQVSLTALPASGTLPPPAPLPAASGDDTKCVYIVNKDFEEENSKYYNGAAVEMSVRVGEMVRVEQFDVEWWYCCKLDRHGRGTAERGWVPECFLSVPSEYASANRMKLRDKIRKSAQQRRGVAR